MPRQKSLRAATAGACFAALCGIVAVLPTAGRAHPQDASYIGKSPVLAPSGTTFGAYDPHGDFKDVAGDTIEHIFMPWQDVDLSTLASADGYAHRRGRSLLVTVEPWSWSATSSLTATQLRDSILAGRDDSLMANVCRAIGGLKSPVTIRWGHEMDGETGRYPWSGWKPADYIAAYRHVVDLCRPLAPKAMFMWSPAGDAGLAAYYPGDAYVDEIGLSVFGLQKFDHDQYRRDRSFADVLKPKYDRVAHFKKPVCVAELGYSGDETYNVSWARAVTARNPAFPRLNCVVYFNDLEPSAWPAPYGKPDWRVRGGEMN